MQKIPGGDETGGRWHKKCTFRTAAFPRQNIMKLRLGLILLLFVASAGILVWLYYAATREPRSPKGSPWAETLADLDACCRRKHVKSVQYDHFADIAADEKRHTAERLFRAMAFSERLQENNWRDGRSSVSEAIIRPRGRSSSSAARPTATSNGASPTNGRPTPGAAEPTSAGRWSAETAMRRAC